MLARPWANIASNHRVSSSLNSLFLTDLAGNETNMGSEIVDEILTQQCLFKNEGLEDFLQYLTLFYNALESAGNKFSQNLVNTNKMANIDSAKLSNCKANSWEHHLNNSEYSLANTLLDEVLY